MTYLICILLILFGIYKFDLGKIVDVKDHYYYLIVAYLILVSTLAYRIGDDGTVYEEEFLEYGNITNISKEYFMLYGGRLPGWVLLTTICKSIIPSYCFFKFFFSLIVNISFSALIKNITTYRFTGLLIYFGLLYFSLNFGILRQSIAIAIFVYSTKYINERRYVKYYLLCIVAFMFHEASAIMLVVPLFSLVKLSKKSILIYIGLILLLFAKADTVFSFIQITSIEQESLSRLSLYTAKAEGGEANMSFFNLALNVLLPSFLLYYRARSSNVKLFEKSLFSQSYYYLVVLYIFIYILSSFVPIFYRFNYFFYIFYYVTIIDTLGIYLSRFPMTIIARTALITSFVMVLFFVKNRHLFNNYPETNIPAYITIYPYESVIFEQKIPEREKLYNLLH